MPQLSEYKLPVIDTETQRRNFPGYEKKQYYTLEEIRKGDPSGTTDTDSKTDDPDEDDAGYTNINKKKGPTMRPWKSSSPREA